MKLSIFNFSSKSDEVINGYINSFIKEIANSISEVKDIEWEINDIKLKGKITDLIEKYNDKGPLINNWDFNIELSNLNVYENDSGLILIGEKLNTSNDWGEESIKLVVIKKVEEKNVWHEISHLFGTKDHYDTTTHEKLDICESETCIMQFGLLKGTFCKEAINEMKRFFGLLNN